MRVVNAMNMDTSVNLVCRSACGWVSCVCCRSSTWFILYGWFLLFFIFVYVLFFFFFFSSRRRHTRSKRDWSSDVCSSDLEHEHHVARHLLRLRQLGARRDEHHEVAVLIGVGPVRHRGQADVLVARRVEEIGRASCRERV